MRPDLAMSAGMMPAFETPGLMMPGQFGPMIRVVPALTAYWKNCAVSCTGMPSVITTTSGRPASMASSTAALAKRGGTKTTETLAPGRVHRRGTSSKMGMPSTSCPALPGVTPATICAPEADHAPRVLGAFGSGHALHQDAWSSRPAR